MTDIAQVIAWKFNNQSGMETVDGVITKFPGGIPSQQDQDLWTAEYLARDTGEERVAKAFEPPASLFNSSHRDMVRVIFEAFFEVANRLQVLEGKQPITRPQLKTWLKDKLP